MFKKYLSAVISVLVILSSVCTAGAAGVYSSQSAQTLVKSLNIMVGDESGNMNLDAAVTRAEFSKIAINASKYKNMVALGATVSVFKDCTYTHWAAPYVKVAVSNGIITGYPDGTFRPEDTVLYEEAITVFLKLLGYTDDDFGNSWPYGQAGIAANLGLNKNIDKTIGSTMTRGDIMTLVYNVLTANLKGTSNEYISVIDGVFYEDAVIMSTNREDTSVGANSVLTSVGTFKINDGFDYSTVGLKGDLAVKTSGELLAFMPYSQTSKKYVVYSKLDNSIVAYSDGRLSELDISDNTTVYSGSDKYTFANAKNTMNTGDVIYVVSDSKGSVEYLTLRSDAMEGPYTLSAYSDTWYTMFTNDASSLTVMRDGVKVSVSDVKTNDILYYSSDLNIVFAYSKKITGIYEKATPNKDTPTSVVISGTEYTIESVTAFNKLSSSGSINYGDTVTLLFGKDGQIADVISADGSLKSSSVAGYLTETGTKVFENSNDESYSSKYAKLILADGTEAQYVTNSDYSSYINSVMQVNFENGIASLSYKRSNSGVSGTVDASAGKIGSSKVSENVSILDVSTTNKDHLGAYCSTYMSRLDGMSISSTNVLWYKKNSDNEITELILKDVTGDSCSYGIITDSPNSAKAGNASYTVDISGQSYKYSGGTYSNIGTGSAVKVELSQGSAEAFSALNMISGNVSKLTETYAEIRDTDYKLSGNVCAYKKVNSYTYTVMPMSELIKNADNYTVTAYCDKAEKNGGRIRILIAQ